MVVLKYVILVAKNDTKDEIFKPTIEYMLINNVKLEQEAIDLEDFN